MWFTMPRQSRRPRNRKVHLFPLLFIHKVLETTKRMDQLVRVSIFTWQHSYPAPETPIEWNPSNVLLPWRAKPPFQCYSPWQSKQFLPAGKMTTGTFREPKLSTFTCTGKMLLSPEIEWCHIELTFLRELTGTWQAKPKPFPSVLTDLINIHELS